MAGKAIDKLSDLAIKSAALRAKPYKLADGLGLYIEVMPNGSKYWRLKYRYGGKEKRLAIGVYPIVTLKRARQAARDARDLLARGGDPVESKRQEKLARSVSAANSFRAVAEEWAKKYTPRWSESHNKRVAGVLANNLLPWLGHRPIASITPAELLSVLRKTESQGLLETTKRAKGIAGQIFRYAVVTGRAERDPTPDLKGALASPITTHHAALTKPAEVGAMLRAFDSFRGTAAVRAALYLSPLLLCRPGELRHMEWTEINWTESRWEISAEKMKMRLPHIVPLSTQAIEILRELKPVTGGGRYVFPSARGDSRPLSENAVRVALRSLGLTNEQMTPHGFRATARTLLDEELGYRPDLIDHQLAHAVKDPNGRAYNRTSFLKERKAMLQGWADYLDSLKAKGTN